MHSGWAGFSAGTDAKIFIRWPEIRSAGVCDRHFQGTATVISARFITVMTNHLADIHLIDVIAAENRHIVRIGRL